MLTVLRRAAPSTAGRVRGIPRCQRRAYAEQDNVDALRRLGTSASGDRAPSVGHPPRQQAAARPGEPAVVTESRGDRWSGGGGRRDHPNARPSPLGHSTVIKVRAETKTASLSGWLTTRLRETKDPVTMTTIGAKGVNQIIKAVSVAHELLHEEAELVCKVLHTHTITDDGSPASFFSVTIRPLPPRGDTMWRGQTPNRVGKTSHIPTMQQMAQTAQKTGQVCTFAVAGPESTIKAMLTIAGLGPSTQFSPVLVKNEEGEYVAIHLRVLPPPGAPKTVFVSKFTKPAKLAGFIKFSFTSEEGPKRIRLVASADAHDAVRSMVKACEYASDYLEQDRMPISFSVELAEDDDAISAGSFVVTLSRDVSKEQTAAKVTVGLGNLEPKRIQEQIKGGLEAGKLVLLRSTLQGAVPSMEALARLNETYPVLTYSKPKDVQYSDLKEQRGSALLDAQRGPVDRFYLEMFVERTPTPVQIVIPQVGRPFIPQKVEGIMGALKVHKRAVLKVLSHENGGATLRIAALVYTAFQENHQKSMVVFKTVIQQLGFELDFSIVPIPADLNPRTLGRSHEVPLRNRETRESRRAPDVAEELLQRFNNGVWSSFTLHSLDQMQSTARILGHAKLPALARLCHTSGRTQTPGVEIVVPPLRVLKDIEASGLVEAEAISVSEFPISESEDSTGTTSEDVPKEGHEAPEAVEADHSNDSSDEPLPEDTPPEAEEVEPNTSQV
eukprot:Hpha_TRINITY_DN22944_c0_g1::TRINITY_DN22944_c0_g1_i1::g.154139::m.154139